MAAATGATAPAFVVLHTPSGMYYAGDMKFTLTRDLHHATRYPVKADALHTARALMARAGWARTFRILSATTAARVR